MFKKIYSLKKITILGLFLAVIVFTFACQEESKSNDEELLKKDSQSSSQLGEMNAALTSKRFTSDNFERLKKIFEKYPNAQKARQTYLNALFFRKDWQAISEFLNSKSTNKLSREEKIILANTYFKLGNYQKTIEIYAPLPEKDFEIKNLLGQSYLQIGQTADAATSLEEIKDRSIAQKRVDVLSSLGLIYLRQNEFPKAVEILKKAVELDPNHIPSNNALSLVYARQNDMENAEKYRQRTVELQKKSTEQTFESSQRVQKVYEIENAWNAKNYEEVIKIADEMIPLTENKAEKIALYQYLYESYKATGKTQEAEKAAAEGKKVEQQK